MTEQSLERELRMLRVEFKTCEKKLKALQVKTAEMSGTKRRRSEGDLRDSNSKRLKSAAVTVGNVDGQPGIPHTEQESAKTEHPIKSKPNFSEEKRPEVTPQNSEDKKRNRRLFGSLLIGTLASFKKQVESEAQILQQRKEVERITEEKVSSEHQKFLEEQQKKLQEDISTFQARLDKVLQEIQTKDAELMKLKSAAHAKLLSNFLITKNCTPAIYYFPGKQDEFTERVLGTKPLISEIKLETNSKELSNATNAPEMSVEKSKKTSDSERKDVKDDHVPVEEAPKKEDERSEDFEKDEKQATEDKQDQKRGEKSSDANGNSGGNEEELAEGVTPHS